MVPTTNTSEAGLETLIAEAYPDEQIVATLTRQLISLPHPKNG